MMIVSNTIFGPCPNTDWDHYVDYEEINNDEVTNTSKNNNNIFKRIWKNILNM